MEEPSANHRPFTFWAVGRGKSFKQRPGVSPAKETFSKHRQGFNGWLIARNNAQFIQFRACDWYPTSGACRGMDETCDKMKSSPWLEMHYPKGLCLCWASTHLSLWRAALMSAEHLKQILKGGGKRELTTQRQTHPTVAPKSPLQPVWPLSPLARSQHGMDWAMT